MKQTTEAAVEQAKGFLGKLLGPAFEEAGLILQDRVRQYRLGNQIKILEKARGMLADVGLDVRAVPLKTLLPLLENASLEEETDLQEKWAALLANASAAEPQINVLPSFAELLRQLSPQEARLLDGLYDQICNELVRVYDRVNASTLQYVGAAGLTHDAVGALFVELKIGTKPWVGLGKHVHPDDLARCETNRIRLGVALDNLKRLALLNYEPGTKYRDKYSLSTLGYEFVNACRAPKKQ